MAAKVKEVAEGVRRLTEAQAQLDTLQVLRDIADVLDGLNVRVTALEDEAAARRAAAEHEA